MTDRETPLAGHPTSGNPFPMTDDAGAPTGHAHDAIIIGAGFAGMHQLR